MPRSLGLPCIFLNGAVEERAWAGTPPVHPIHTHTGPRISLRLLISPGNFDCLGFFSF